MQSSLCVYVCTCVCVRMRVKYIHVLSSPTRLDVEESEGAFNEPRGQSISRNLSFSLRVADRDRATTQARPSPRERAAIDRVQAWSWSIPAVSALIRRAPNSRRLYRRDRLDSSASPLTRTTKRNCRPEAGATGHRGCKNPPQSKRSRSSMTRWHLEDVRPLRRRPR